MLKKLLILLLVLLINLSVSNAQSPYKTHWRAEIPYVTASIGTIGYGTFLHSRHPIFTTDELMTLDPKDINRLDRFATGKFSSKADKLSDVFWIGSHAIPGLFLIGKESRTHFGQIMTLYGEAATFNFGVTVISKSLFRRPRPFVFNPDVVESSKLKKSSTASFVSGHTSMTALNTFFAAKVFSDFYPDSKWKPVVWVTAATIPAITGYLRIAAGRHYPTDTMAGYVLGGTIGILVPHLHRNKNLEAVGLRFDVGFNNAMMTWNFNPDKKEKGHLNFGLLDRFSQLSLKLHLIFVVF